MNAIEIRHRLIPLLELQEAIREVIVPLDERYGPENRSGPFQEHGVGVAPFVLRVRRSRHARERKADKSWEAEEGGEHYRLPECLRLGGWAGHGFLRRALPLLREIQRSEALEGKVI